MRKGFSFVEIMVVVAIIVLLVAAAIPNLLRSRLNGSESSAISNLQTISVASQTYLSTQNSFPTTLAQLNNQSLLDQVLGCNTTSCTKNGYNYSMGGTGATTDFFVYTIPQTANITGVRSFCSGSDGVIRSNSSGSTPASQTACNLWSAL
jgi:prepilin-type N-terminal cleavage/methylation domain-containing protein